MPHTKHFLEDCIKKITCSLKFHLLTSRWQNLCCLTLFLGPGMLFCNYKYSSTCINKNLLHSSVVSSKNTRQSHLANFSIAVKREHFFPFPWMGRKELVRSQSIPIFKKDTLHISGSKCSGTSLKYNDEDIVLFSRHSQCRHIIICVIGITSTKCKRDPTFFFFYVEICSDPYLLKILKMFWTRTREGFLSPKVLFPIAT